MLEWVFIISWKHVDAGLVYIFYSLFIIWATDSGAYFTGRAIGKRKLWPEISPNKTIEGFIGGIISAVIVSILFDVFTEMNVPIIWLSIVTFFYLFLDKWVILLSLL